MKKAPALEVVAPPDPLPLRVVGSGMPWRDTVSVAANKLPRAPARLVRRAEIPAGMLRKTALLEDLDIKSVLGRMAVQIETAHGTLTCLAFGPAELDPGRARIRDWDPVKGVGEVMAEIEL